MLSLLAAAALHFTPFQIELVVRQPDGLLVGAHSKASYATREACEAARDVDAKFMASRGWRADSDAKAPPTAIRIVSHRCIAEGIKA